MRLDCRDLDCPIPVLKTKEALEEMEEGILDVELNTLSSIENVKRFVKSQGLYFEEKKIAPRHVVLSIVKGYACTLDVTDKSAVNTSSNETNTAQEALRAAQIAAEARERQKERSLYALIIGGVVSAILASTCCLAPLLFLLFGVSVGSLSFLQAFAPYRLYFTIAAVAVVGYLWFDWYRGRKERIACATSLCKNYLLYLSLGTLFVVLMLSYPWWAALLLSGN